jgi:hypothetical protein
MAKYGSVEVDQYTLTDMLKATTHNAGCEGIGRELQYAVSNMTERERGKLVALCGRYGYTTQTDANAAKSGVEISNEIAIYEAQKREDARALAEGRKSYGH